VVQRISAICTLPYDDIPDFPEVQVDGHAGSLLLGKCDGVGIACMQGRVHVYEGYTASQVAYPVRVLRALGVEILLLTNAAGAVNTGFGPGDLMLITDHINFMGSNPLIGQCDDRLGPRFLDLTQAYDRGLRSVALGVAEELGIRLHEGIYLAVTGPLYETPAEIRAFRTLGADAVGMSTVPETIVANQVGMKVCAISALTNMAAGISAEPLSHEEVIRMMAATVEAAGQLLLEIVAKVGQ